MRIVMTLPHSSLAGPHWTPPPRRTRPGRRPLPVDIARAGRLLERWWSGQVDETAALRGLLVHLAPRSALDVEQVRATVGPALDYLRRESADCRARLDATCPCEVAAELCQDCWTSLGAWWNHQLVHLTSIRDALSAGGCTG